MTSERARTALKEQIAASPEFAKSLQWPDAPGEEEDGSVDEGSHVDGVVYNEIDSLKMIDEETMDLILQQPVHPLVHKPDADSDHDDDQVVRPNIERYTGHEFSSQQLPIH